MRRPVGTGSVEHLGARPRPWRARIMLDGKSTSRCFDRRSDAEKWIAERRREGLARRRARLTEREAELIRVEYAAELAARLEVAGLAMAAELIRDDAARRTMAVDDAAALPFPTRKVA